MSGDLSMCHNTRQMQLWELEPLGHQEPLSPWPLGRRGGGGQARGGWRRPPGSALEALSLPPCGRLWDPALPLSAPLVEAKPGTPPPEGT